MSVQEWIWLLSIYHSSECCRFPPSDASLLFLSGQIKQGSDTEVILFLTGERTNAISVMQFFDSRDPRCYRATSPPMEQRCSACSPSASSDRGVSSELNELTQLQWAAGWDINKAWGASGLSSDDSSAALEIFALPLPGSRLTATAS